MRTIEKTRILIFESVKYLWHVTVMVQARSGDAAGSRGEACVETKPVFLCQKSKLCEVFFGNRPIELELDLKMVLLKVGSRSPG